MLEVYMKLFEQGYYEVKFAFEGLGDENVWKRPGNNLLAIGELAGHIAYWEAVRLAGCEVERRPSANGISLIPDLTTCVLSSPLLDHRFGGYFTSHNHRRAAF